LIMASVLPLFQNRCYLLATTFARNVHVARCLLTDINFHKIRTKELRNIHFSNRKLAAIAKMPGDKKLETADELWDLYNDMERLKSYKYTQPIVSECGINNEKFHMELPYEEIKKIVENCRDTFMAAVPEDERKSLRWEHVGSTSIKGMPGAMMPDALLIIPEFPPSKGIIQAFLDCGYYFSSASHLDVRDLWWFLVFTEGLLKDHKLTVHVVTEDNPAANILLDTRDMCRNEEWAFNDYKQAKVDAAKGSWMEYKQGKGSNSKLLTMLKEKYKM